MKLKKSYESEWDANKDINIMKSKGWKVKDFVNHMGDLIIIFYIK